MQPILTVEGKEIEVYAVYYREGKINSVTIENESGNLVTYHDVNEDTKYYIEQPLKVDFATALKFPGIEAQITERENKLIEHLDSFFEKENDELLGIAIDAMEGEVEEPFALNLVNKQQEYKLQQKRVLGIIDAVEEVKAYLEGYYAGDSDE